MHKLVPIDDIYTDQFVVGKAISVRDIPFIQFAKQIINDPDIRPEDTEYYKWIENLLIQHGEVWESIRTAEDITKRVEKFKGMVKSLKENGYRLDMCDPLYVRGSNIYGGLTARVWENGYKLIDGSHRLSILIALGATEALLTICE